MKNYYTILGINNDATQEQIKKAYRKLSLKFHPDKNDNDEFLSEMFKNINEANEILSDSEKRKSFDLYLSNYTTTHQQSKKSPEPPPPDEYPNIRKLVTIYVEKDRINHFAKHQFELAEKLSKPTNFSFSNVFWTMLIIAGCYWYFKPNFNLSNEKSSFELLTTENVIVYSKPNIKSKSIFFIDKNTELNELESTKYFIKIQFTDASGNNQTGYIRKLYVKKNDKLEPFNFINF